jgi:DNA-binding NarL/FixJ family response regulator
MGRLKVLIADDHTVVRQGFRRIVQEQPGWEVVGEASNGREAVRLAVRVKPDVAVIDIAMPQLNGIEAVRQISKQLPLTRVVVLSMFADEPYVLRALQAGAQGYIVKDSADEDLVRAIREVASGKSFFSPAVTKVVLDAHLRKLADQGITDRFDSLSDREREVLQLVAEGHSGKEIAEILGISPTTVETHRNHIMEKLDLHSTAELILYAVRKGIIT